MNEKPEKSKRDRIRDLAEESLGKAGKPLHNIELTEAVLTKLGIVVRPKDLNTALHDDPQARFTRVKRGTWTIRPRPKS